MLLPFHEYTVVNDFTRDGVFYPRGTRFTLLQTKETESYHQQPRYEYYFSVELDEEHRAWFTHDEIINYLEWSD